MPAVVGFVAQVLGSLAVAAFRPAFSGRTRSDWLPVARNGWLCRTARGHTHGGCSLTLFLDTVALSGWLRRTSLGYALNGRFAASLLGPCRVQWRASSHGSWGLSQCLLWRFPSSRSSWAQSL